MTTSEKLTAALVAVKAAVAADCGDDWDAPAAEAAREATYEAGLVWEFTTWENAAEMIEDRLE